MSKGRAIRQFAITASIAALTLGASSAHADTLQEALTEAYFNNPTLEAARAGQRATDEAVQIERADGLPSAEATASVTEFLKQSSTSFFTPDRALTAGVDLGVPIYSGGAVKNSVRAAKERVAAGRADLRGTESAIFTQVVAAYMDVLRGQALFAFTQPGRRAFREYAGNQRPLRNQRSAHRCCPVPGPSGVGAGRSAERSGKSDSRA